jgi:hypothetical protein
MIEAENLSKRHRDKPAAYGLDFGDQPGIVPGSNGEVNG